MILIKEKYTKGFKDDQHPTYVIMLYKRGTSMISANFFRNACAKNEKIFIFLFEINEDQCLNTSKL